MTDAATPTENTAPAVLPRLDPNTKEERNWAMLCHLISFSGFLIPFGNIFGPLMLWLLKREEWPQVDDQGKESLNFQITWTIFFCISIVLCFLVVGFFILPVVLLFDLIMVVTATIKASEGELYRYPLTLRFID